MILADKIIELRKKNGWSQEELAEKLGVSRQSISKWEGAQSLPDMNRIIKMSELFGVSTDILLRDELVLEPSTIHTEELVPDSSLTNVSVEEA
ncbi:MAG TPA: helix-turn-helix transcriptional regulator, partial [Bacillota bacterium]|nr:helix-turn-helix transcriptional regulator [Bacillota bacterium]